MGARRRRELIGIIAVFAAFALLARFGGGGLVPPPLPDLSSPSQGEAPPFDLPAPGGDLHRLAEHRDEVVLQGQGSLRLGRSFQAGEGPTIKYWVANPDSREVE